MMPTVSPNEPVPDIALTDVIAYLETRHPSVAAGIAGSETDCPTIRFIRQQVKAWPNPHPDHWIMPPPSRCFSTAHLIDGWIEWREDIRMPGSRLPIPPAIRAFEASLAVFHGTRVIHVRDALEIAREIHKRIPY